jgi:hypothetical protein
VLRCGQVAPGLRVGVRIRGHDKVSVGWASGCDEKLLSSTAAPVATVSGEVHNGPNEQCVRVYVSAAAAAAGDSSYDLLTGINVVIRPT